MFYLSSFSLISQWILRACTFISSHVVTVVLVLGSPSGKRGDWGWDKIVFSFFVNNSYRRDRMLRFKSFVFTCLTYKNVQRFGTGQSTNSMVRIMKANQMSKVCVSSQEYPHVEEKRIFVNGISKVRWPSWLTGNELTSGQKEKPHGKKKNLRVKRKTSGQKEKPHRKKKKTRGKKNNLTAKEIRIKKMSSQHQRNFAVSLFLFAGKFFFLPWGFSFCREVILLAVRFFFLPWG